MMNRWKQVWMKDYKNNKYLYLMVLPVLLYYIVFHYAPLYGATIAFKQFDVGRGLWNSPWIGFQHFRDFFDSYYFWRLMKNTLLLNVYQLLFAFPAPIIFALLINEITGKRFKQIVQTITYLPHFVSIIVISGMIHQFLARDGVLTDVLVWLGMERTAFLGHAEFFRTIFVSSDIWQHLGWGSIIYLAAISAINPDLYEASRMDGAGRFKQIWHVTIPGIMPIIIILFILKMGQMMDVGFEKVILLYNPNTYVTADVINSFVYRRGLGTSFEFSYTTAIGLFQSVLNFSLLVFANWFSRKVNETSLW